MLLSVASQCDGSIDLNHSLLREPTQDVQYNKQTIGEDEYSRAESLPCHSHACGIGTCSHFAPISRSL